MKKIWMMISSLQILVHYPMLKIPMPANLIMLLAAIVDIVNLGLVPKKYVKEILSNIIADTKDDVNENFKEMDIF